MDSVALWIAGLAALSGVVFAAWRALSFAAGERVRAEVLRFQEAERARIRRAHEVRDREIERVRIETIKAIRAEVAARKTIAGSDIDTAEAELRKRTKEPWKP